MSLDWLKSVAEGAFSALFETVKSWFQKQKDDQNLKDLGGAQLELDLKKKAEQDEQVAKNSSIGVAPKHDSLRDDDGFKRDD